MIEDDQDAIIQLLAEGYGAEDIALRLVMPLDQVRQFIRDLRSDGILGEIYA